MAYVTFQINFPHMGIFYNLVVKIDYTTYFKEQKNVNIVYGIDQLIRGMKQMEQCTLPTLCVCVSVQND